MADLIALYRLIDKYENRLNQLINWLKDSLEKGFPGNHKINKDEWREVVVEALVARDGIETFLRDTSIAVDISVSTLKRIFDLDQRLKKLSREIVGTDNFWQLQAFYDPKGEKWWWNPYCFSEQFSWLFNFVIIILMVLSVGWAANIAFRLWEGGPNITSIVSVIVTGLTGIFLGKDNVNNTSFGLEDILRKMGFPKHVWKPITLVSSLLLFIFMLFLYKGLPQMSTCFYERGIDLAFSPDEQKKLRGDSLIQKQCNPNIPGKVLIGVYDFSELFGAKNFEVQQVAQAESNLKIANAMDPDSSEVNFALGYLYELQNDNENARKAYQSATRNGSRFSRIRLAKLYLLTDEVSKSEKSALIASNLLLQARKTEELSVLEIDIRLALAVAFLQQKRFSEAEFEVKDILENLQSLAWKSKPIDKAGLTWLELKNNIPTSVFVDELEKKVGNSNFLSRITDPLEGKKPLYRIDCIRVIVLDAQKSATRSDIDLLAQECIGNISDPGDSFQDYLTGQAKKIKDRSIYKN